MHPELEKLKQRRIIPVVTLANAQDASPLAEALIKGGLPCAEITLRTDAAIDSIRTMSQRKDIQVGAGTVLKIDQVKAAVDNGATFIVSPGLNPKVTQYCIEQKIPITPGITNPTDIEMALELGLEVVKFFPAEAFGGVKTLQAISTPYGMIQFIPTGGININNLVDYLRLPSVFACGGSWMVRSELIAKQQFDVITKLTKEAVSVCLLR